MLLIFLFQAKGDMSRMDSRMESICGDDDDDDSDDGSEGGRRRVPFEEFSV